MATGWWYRASTSQKLRQIDAGIELGMTARQIAMVSGVNMRFETNAVDGATVASFARFHDRRLGDSPAKRRGAGIKGSDARYARHRAIRAYASGEPVDFWSSQPRAPLVNDDLPQEVAFE